MIFDEKGASRLRGLEEKILVREKYTFSRVDYELRMADGQWVQVERNLFRRPDATVILPYDPARKMVLLTRQFRLGAYMNDATTGLMEACAGTIDGDEDPEACIRREAMEEMGLQVEELRFLFQSFVSPAASTEKLYFYIAPYAPEMRIAAGGGMEEENEEIEVLEPPFADVLRQADAGEIRDLKTLNLLYWLNASGLME
jgi:GDP-mannose pyrophosphatase NudK